jgi:methyl-accepting chemotaxis protein
MLLVLVVCAVGLDRHLVTPLVRITAAMGELARGNFDVVLPGIGRDDEIGGIAAAVEELKVKAAEKAMRDAEDGRAAEKQRKSAMLKLADQFQSAVGSIIETVASASSKLETAASTLTNTAETTQQLSGMVAAASEQTSVNVQGVAAASEELSSTVTEISRQVQESSTVASQAVEQAQKTNQKVAELSQSAHRIGDVIDLINNIAGQTNLLALNATIEAARAGEAGKGFAVVAQEVKALATQTSKATSEIGAQIASMQAATEHAVEAIHDITATISKINEIAVTISAAVEQQGASTREISRNVLEAAKGTAEVASSITDVSSGASETGTASSQVLISAKALSGESRNLKTEVEKFLANVREA